MSNLQSNTAERKELQFWQDEFWKEFNRINAEYQFHWLRLQNAIAQAKDAHKKAEQKRSVQ